MLSLTEYKRNIQSAEDLGIVLAYLSVAGTFLFGIFSWVFIIKPLADKT